MTTYHIGAEGGGPPMQLMTNANAQLKPNSNLSVAIPPNISIGRIRGTLSLKCAGEIFFKLNGGDGTAENGIFIGAWEFINYPDKDAKTWQINFPLPVNSLLGPTITFNFQYSNMTPFPQASGFEIQLNFITG